MAQAGSGNYRGGSSSVTRAGRHKKAKSDGGLNRVIKTAEKAAAPKGLTFRHAGVAVIPINLKLGGGNLGSRNTWKKKKILE